MKENYIAEIISKREEYIAEIIKLLQDCSESRLDFIYQLLKKSQQA